MLKLLHIDSSILGDQSVSRVLAAAIVQRLKKHNPALEVVHRDLVTRPLPHLTADDLIPAAPAVIGGGVLSEFLAADVIVIGVALYNLGVSSQLKAWIDRIVVPGRTFRYTPHGPEGLSKNKRVILAVARGGNYRTGNSLATGEHAEAYLRSVFGFIGVTKLEVIAADGLAISKAQKESSKQAAMNAISTLDICCKV